MKLQHKAFRPLHSPSKISLRAEVRAGTETNLENDVGVTPSSQWASGSSGSPLVQGNVCVCVGGEKYFFFISENTVMDRAEQFFTCPKLRIFPSEGLIYRKEEKKLNALGIHAFLILPPIRAGRHVSLVEAGKLEVGLTQHGNRKGHFMFFLPSSPPVSPRSARGLAGPDPCWQHHAEVPLPLPLLSPPSLQSLLDQSRQSCILAARSRALRLRTALAWFQSSPFAIFSVLLLMENRVKEKKKPLLVPLVI
ncbi:hypothetical protein LUU34_01024000 [Aix galericulata]|nr:hypothetical protein LUU34_01024000 [Aix galericulata]